MSNDDKLFALEVPGYGWVSWTVSFEDMAPRFPRENILIREESADRPEFAPGECNKRCAIISTTGRVCGVDATVDLNFMENHLCAVHYRFLDSAELKDHDYQALLDCLQAKLGGPLGAPLVSWKAGTEKSYSLEWDVEDLHVELQTHDGKPQRIEIAANDPSECPSCFKRDED
ncbi:MAG: hypothetical protein GF341_05035 [candidate division Zixibacteria bacterium]|nr:hypothetical protein [candidate division Zixibacteria bacterium]